MRKHREKLVLTAIGLGKLEIGLAERVLGLPAFRDVTDDRDRSALSHPVGEQGS